MTSSLIWRLPSDLLATSISVMQPHGAHGNEGLALWFGTGDSRCAEVTHVVDVFGAGFRTSPLHLALSATAMASLTDLCERLGVFLVGQIHSHPGLFVDLSDVDRRHGIRSPDYLSVVCPHYAQRELSGFDACGVHVFEPPYFRRLSQEESERRLVKVSSTVKRLRVEVPR